MKFLYFITLLLIATLVVTTNYAYDKKKSSLKKVNLSRRLNPIIRLAKEGRTYCSGTVIDATTILTASHCVLESGPFGNTRVNEAPIQIIAADNVFRGTFAKVKRNTLSMQLDRVLLKGDFHLFEPAPYISDVASTVQYSVPGTRLVSCGYPLGGDFYCGYGTFIRNVGFVEATTAVIIPGMSGGPTMLEDGRVIAVNIAVNEEGEGLVTPTYNIEREK